MLEVGYFKNGQYGVVDCVDGYEVQVATDLDSEETKVVSAFEQGENLIARLQKCYPHRDGVYLLVDTFNGDTNILSAN